MSLEYKAKRFVRAAARPPLERHHGWKEIFSAEARAALLEPGRRGAGLDPLAGWRARYAETAGAEPLARLQDVDIGMYLVDDLLVKTDRASMAHSLEVRVPFLDPVVAELALALPTSQKVLALAKKRLLRRAAAGLVPRAIVHGPKRGFSIPAAAWLRGELRPFARDVLSPDALRRRRLLPPGRGDAAARRAREPAARTTRARCGGCCASSCGGRRRREAGSGAARQGVLPTGVRGARTDAGAARLPNDTGATGAPADSCA